MKIAIIFDALYPFTVGGGEFRNYEIAKRFVRKGHEVHLFGIKFWEGSGILKKDGLIYHGIIKSKGFYSAKSKRKILLSLKYSLCLFPELIRHDFDIVDCNAFPYFSVFLIKLYSILKKKPFFITWYEVWMDYWNEYLGFFKGSIGRIIELFVSKLSNNHIVISENVKKRLIKLGVNEKEIEIVPCGVTLGALSKIKAKKEKSDICYAGRLMKHKNIDLLIKAISIAKKKKTFISAIIIGEGPEQGKLQILCKNLRLDRNIKFLNFLDNHDDILAYMKSSKIFVLPSTLEGFGIVVIEAMASGKPVIVVRHERNAATELVDNEKNGFICEFSEQDIADKILKLLNNDKLRKEMGQEGIKKSKNYGWDKIVEKLERRYNIVLEK